MEKFLLVGWSPGQAHRILLNADLLGIEQQRCRHLQHYPYLCPRWICRTSVHG